MATKAKKEEELKNTEAKIAETPDTQEAIENEGSGTELAVANNELVSQDDEYAGFDFASMGIDEEELDELTGLDKINAADIRVPYAKLHAKASRGISVGDIELVNGDIVKYEEGKIMLEEISILKFQSVRVYFPKEFDPNNSFICRSFDNIEAAPDGKYAGTKCAACEYSKFPEKGSSPCREQVLALCTDKDDMMFHMLVSGIGVREFKKGFMSVEMMAGLREVKRKLKRQILGALNLKVSVAMEDTDFGEFPKLVFKVDRDKPLVSPERLKTNLEMYASYKTFEDEAVASAATFAQHEQAEYVEPEAEPAGKNDQMF